MMDSKMWVCLLISTITLTNASSASPYQTWLVSASMRVNSCQSQPDAVKVLCQKCALFTKSENVYPMCCENRDDVQLWCGRALEFGLQQ